MSLERRAANRYRSTAYTGGPKHEVHAMSTPETDGQKLPSPPRNASAEPEYAPDLVALRDRLAADGVTLLIPRLGAKCNLPEPIEVDGENASDIIIRWRHEP